MRHFVLYMKQNDAYFILCMKRNRTIPKHYLSASIVYVKLSAL